MAKQKVIAVEEHYQIAQIRETFSGIDTYLLPKWEERLYDLGILRIREMDEAGIDVQIISHIVPGAQKLGEKRSVEMAKLANDTLQQTILRFPDRLAGYTELSLPNPGAAADELERTVVQHGFKGGMINGLTNDRFIDEPHFWPVLERANELRVPLYIHPSTPHPAVIEAYYKDYPSLSRAGWGFGLEAATHATRLIMSGVLDRLPNLKVILGHLGESLPFWLWRADRALTRDGNLKEPFRKTFLDHFYISTSGNFSVPALTCSMMEVGADRILFAVDWPMQTNVEAMTFIKEAPLSDDDREKIMSRNAARIFNIA